MFCMIKRIIRWSDTYKKRIYIGFFLAFFISIFISMPMILAAMGIQLILSDMQDNAVLTNKEIVIFFLLLLASVFGRFFFSYLKSKIQDTVIYERLSDERIQIGDILKRVPLGFFSDHSTGDLVTALTTDLSFMEHHAMSMLDMVVSGYISTAIMLMFCLSIDRNLALMMLAGLLLSALFLHLMGVCSKKNAAVLHNANEDMTSTAIEYVRGIALVKAFHQEGITTKGIYAAYQKSKNINIKIELEYAVFNFLHMLSLKVTSAGMVAYSAVRCFDGSMDFSIMVFVDILSFVVFASAEGFSSAFHVFHVIDHTLDKLDRLTHAQFIDETGKDKNPDHFDISFEDVSFSYQDKPVIKHLTCRFPEGSFTAIVGPSGSGKTTLCNLIARFYDVNEGSICLGGKDLRTYSCDSILRQISIVFQNVYLFHDSILDNIRFAKPDASIEDVMEAAKKARCHEFILSLSDGYHTIVGEAGASLSGGERQRIAIARAILKDAPIIILDEATSSIDPENEHMIQSAIGELIQGKTVIAIAHRLPTIEQADQIFVLENGILSQQGTHNELLHKAGVYQNFVKIRENSENWSL